VNLYLSVVLRPPVPAGVAPQLSLLAAVAVADTIRMVCRLAPEIKWPNDVLLDSRKVCGILAEMQTKGGSLQSVVLGIGVNVNAAMSAFPESLRDKATSLLLAGGREVDRGAFTVKLLTHLEKWYVLWVQEGLAGIRPAWEAHAAGFLGKHVVVNTAKGRVSGLARGLSLDGALVVQRSDADEVYHLVAGDVTIVEGYRRGQSGRSHDAGD
jgi:BirA family biotin operon repressor/biotin-[acetyl-CoA-carboxylase] ligase